MLHFYNPRERQKTKHLFSQRHYRNLVIFFYLATLQYPKKWYEGIYEAFTNILSRLRNTFETLLKSVGSSSFCCLNASWSSGDKWAKGRECLANHNLSSHTEVYSEPFETSKTFDRVLNKPVQRLKTLQVLFLLPNFNVTLMLTFISGN